MTISKRDLFERLDPPPGGAAALRRRLADDRARRQVAARWFAAASLAGAVAVVVVLWWSGGSTGDAPQPTRTVAFDITADAHPALAVVAEPVTIRLQARYRSAALRVPVEDEAVVFYMVATTIEPGSLLTRPGIGEP